MSTEVHEEPDPLVGTTVGNYRILKVLGKGGMGAVYMAEHPIINSKVAIKFLHPQYATDKRVVDRFFNEAKAVNVIGHPNILKILDLSITGDQKHYFVMEFLHGKPLTKLLRKDGVDLGVSGPILLQCCNALEAAHGHGIIHRDLKPDNVYLVSHLGRRNFVKIVDFGIAKLTDLADVGSGRTQTGTVMGTPAYMSPEQATGDTSAIDGRSDVYSLGIMMFQIATGKLPFDGNTFGKLLIQQVQQQPPAPRSINPAIPEAYERVILHTLEKDPAARPQSMTELAEEIHAVMQELGISAELPIDDGPQSEGQAGGSGYISGPKITPPARRASQPSKPSKPSRPAMHTGPEVEPPPPSPTALGGPRHVSKPPTRPPVAMKKKRTGLWIALGGLGTALLAGGGLYAGGVFDEAPAPAPRVKTAAVAEPVPAPPPVEEKAPEPVKPPEEKVVEAAPAPVPEKVAEPEPQPSQEAKAAKAEKKKDRKPKTVAVAEPSPPPAAEPAPPPKPAGIAITAASDPPGAEVVARWDGGEKRGKAPLKLEVPKGTRVKMTFSLKGYSPSEEEVTAEDPRTVTAELVQLLGD